VFAENVNVILQIVHLPTVKAMVRDWRSREMKGLTPANEALMFSIYYAAVTSMEEDDVRIRFGSYGWAEHGQTKLTSDCI
jgi:hypothetical protein